MTGIQRRLTKALHVANCWSSDQTGNGLALLSLGTTRRIHSAGHRTEALAEIDANINWNRAWTGTPDGVNDPARDIPALEDLLRLVADAKVGVEWLTDTQNMRFNDELYQECELD